MRAALLLLIAAVALAACGGHDDRLLARRSVLTLRDLPAGWSTDGTIGRRESSCPGLAATKRAASGTARSAGFTHSQQTETTTEVAVYADATAATRALDRAGSAATMRCYERELLGAASRSPGITPGPATVTRLTLGTPGDQRAGTRITVPLRGGGRRVDLYVDLVFVRTGRAVSLGQFVQDGTPFDPVLRARLTFRQSQRLAATLH